MKSIISHKSKRQLITQFVNDFPIDDRDHLLRRALKLSSSEVAIITKFIPVARFTQAVTSMSTLQKKKKRSIWSGETSVVHIVIT